MTIRNLEEEKDKVQLVEKEKIDFLRTASHELKTPVTELNATLENMILKIGEYSDYESYLPRCKEITEQLAEMIKDILMCVTPTNADGGCSCNNFFISRMC